MDPWRTSKRVLCVRLDTMSGVLLTTPALRALRQSLPGCRLAMLTSASGAQAARLTPRDRRRLPLRGPVDAGQRRTRVRPTPRCD